MYKAICLIFIAVLAYSCNESYTSVKIKDIKDFEAVPGTSIHSIFTKNDLYIKYNNKASFSHPIFKLKLEETKSNVTIPLKQKFIEFDFSKGHANGFSRHPFANVALTGTKSSILLKVTPNIDAKIACNLIITDTSLYQLKLNQHCTMETSGFIFNKIDSTRLYFCINYNSYIAPKNQSSKICLCFDKNRKHVVNIKIAFSDKSSIHARDIMFLEQPDFNFPRVKSMAQQEWHTMNN